MQLISEGPPWVGGIGKVEIWVQDLPFQNGLFEGHTHWFLLLRTLPPKHKGLLMQLLPFQTGLFDGHMHCLFLRSNTRPPEQTLIFGMQITPVQVGAFDGHMQMPLLLRNRPPVHCCGGGAMQT